MNRAATIMAMGTGSVSSGGVVLLDSYPDNDSGLSVWSAGSFHGIGQVFSSGSGGTLDSCKFDLAKSGSPSGTVNARLYASTGTFGTNAMPTGTALATSDGINVTTLPTTHGLVTFSFSGADRYSMAAATNYCITFEYTGASGVNVRVDTTSPTHAGNICRLSTSDVWGGTSIQDCAFEVYIFT